MKIIVIIELIFYFISMGYIYDKVDSNYLLIIQLATYCLFDSCLYIGNEIYKKVYKK